MQQMPARPFRRFRFDGGNQRAMACAVLDKTFAKENRNSYLYVRYLCVLARLHHAASDFSNASETWRRMMEFENKLLNYAPLHSWGYRSRPHYQDRSESRVWSCGKYACFTARHASILQAKSYDRCVAWLPRRGCGRRNVRESTTKPRGSRRGCFQDGGAISRFQGYVVCAPMIFFQA